ncbi:MAG: hypothetical protein M3Z46_10235 [Actinomycetota bacterium]|nr:hypothetical protein [Actinomycetota bacterium]
MAGSAKTTIARPRSVSSRPVPSPMISVSVACSIGKVVLDIGPGDR